MVNVFLPSILAKVTGENKLSVNTNSVGGVIEFLIDMYGNDIKDIFYDQTGEWVRFWQIFVNGVNVRFLNYFETGLDDNDEVAFLPVIDGG